MKKIDLTMKRVERSKTHRIEHIYTHWLHQCGWCGNEVPVATDGRNLFCSYCGRW